MQTSLKESAMRILLNENDSDENRIHNRNTMNDILKHKYRGQMAFKEVEMVEYIHGNDNKCRFILSFNVIHVTDPNFMCNVVADVTRALRNTVFLYNDEGDPLEIVSIDISGKPFDFWSTHSGIVVNIEFEAKIKKHA